MLKRRFIFSFIKKRVYGGLKEQGMREIKFRAWDKKEKKFYNDSGYNPDLLINGTKGCVFVPADMNDIQDRWDLNQYTGLKDKNGKEIYEGDILECFNPFEMKSKISEIKWCEEYAALMNIIGNDALSLYHFISEDYEIIGNIYETPEILKA